MEIYLDTTLPLFHGTPYKFDKFREGNITYFTPDYNFAYDYASIKSQDNQMDADIRIIEVRAYEGLKLFDVSIEGTIEEIEGDLPEKIWISGTWGGTEITKEEFINRLKGIYKISNPLFLQKIYIDTKKDERFEEMSVYHHGLWRVVNIDDNLITAQKIRINKKEIDRVYHFELFNGDYGDNPMTAFNNLVNSAKERGLLVDRQSDIYSLYKEEVIVIEEKIFDKSKDSYYIKEDIDWTTFEGDPQFLKILINHGYHGIKMKEKNSDTYALFYPENLKIIKNYI